MTKQCVKELEYIQEHLWEEDFDHSQDIHRTFDKILAALIGKKADEFE